MDKPRIVIGTWKPDGKEKQAFIKSFNKRLEEGYRHAQHGQNVSMLKRQSARRQRRRYETYDLKTFHTRKRLRRRRPHQGKWAATMSAVATGVALGLFVLWLLPDRPPFFSDQKIAAEKPQPTQVIDAHDAQFAFPDTASSSQSPTADSQGTKLALQPVYLVQAGLFSDLASAKTLLSQQQKQGWSGVVTEEAPYRVYVGVSPSRDEALAIASFYKEKGLEVYVKAWNWDSGDLSGADASEQRTLSQMVSDLERLYRKLAGISVVTLSQKAIDRSAIDQLKQAHQSWIANLEQLPDTLRGNAALKALATQMNQAVQNVFQYQSSPDPAIAWQLQNDLITALLKQEQWLRSLSKDERHVSTATFVG